ncbi:hypothetical protein OED52_13785 [Rhodococcus sp. Z13]|uniref:Uncharacterized protein n=1 Tax=Rhodococcus sacchari TaxID=2962047 RepID=A0ACD4DDJ3_9NOCA|nr:hypothetical protein [Rhodococcus sp. Z13]UYP17743.1 hypothetical protein OED52_13785 [Rhodococcus sp. Z13]
MTTEIAPLRVGARVKLKPGVSFGPIMELTVDRVFKNGWLEASSDNRSTRVKVRHQDVIVKPICSCWCSTCEDEYIDAMEQYDPRIMPTWDFIVCPDCGNKRCPKATHHDHTCTGSNAPGQKGSRYA